MSIHSPSPEVESPVPQSVSASGEDDLHLKLAARLIAKRRRLVLGTVLVSMVLSVLYYLVATPAYTSVATLEARPLMLQSKQGRVLADSVLEQLGAPLCDEVILAVDSNRTPAPSLRKGEAERQLSTMAGS